MARPLHRKILILFFALQPCSQPLYEGVPSNTCVAHEPCKCCTNGETAPHCSICTGTSLFVNE